MSRIHALLPISGPGLVRGLAVLAFTAGLGVWGALLMAPLPRSLPATLSPASADMGSTASVARWFGGSALRVRVAVMGLITAKNGRGAALLAINGGAAQAYRVGQVLAPGVSLVAVTPDAVSIDQDGVTEKVLMPANPTGTIVGFVPVPGSASQGRP